ncbi:MAG: hypothetical protein ABI352_10275 [Candidatus Dormibacter sp.]
MDTDNTLMPPPPPAKAPLFGRKGRRAAVAATAVGLMTGAFAGGSIVTHAATAAASPSASASTPSTTTPATGTAPAPGTFHSNENATHEAGESVAREAQENAGQVPTVR